MNSDASGSYECRSTRRCAVYDQEGHTVVSTKVAASPHPSVEIFIRGMGTNCTPDCSPIYLEFYEGAWRLHVWADINQEDPTHTIDMSGALQSLRGEQGYG